MTLRELITNGDLSVEESARYRETLCQAFEQVWRKYRQRDGAAWGARRTWLYAKINGKTRYSAETAAREAIGRLVRESGCPASAAHEIQLALRRDWRDARNTANLMLATLD